MPGTIIDALSAGVPVIARRWQYCDEMLTDGVNGYVYDFDKPELLKEKIMYAITHEEQTAGMRKNCLATAERYSEKNVISQVLASMGISEHAAEE